MYSRLRSLLLALILLFVGIQAYNGFAQGKNHNKKAWPDSLTSVTLEGTVIIDSTHEDIYFLDVDGDEVVDYHLAFGPDWYVPESGAVRPQEGDHVKIVGSVNPKPAIPVVIVFEINDLVWREAVENWWQHQDWCDSLETVTVTGTILVDTTYFYLHYYLDEDGDGEPDYFLGFGPPWYEPESGATHPEEGATVTIEGVLKGDADELPKLAVLTIDGEVWREKSGPAPWSGGWIAKEHKKQKRIHTPTDTCSWLEVPPGAMKGGGNMGPQFPDSLFCEFMNVWHDSLPGQPDSAIAGWHFFFSNPNGKQHKGNGAGRVVRFIKRLRMQLNVCQGDSGGFNLAKSNAADYKLMAWDEETLTWFEVEDATFDPETGSFKLEPEAVTTYYAIFSTTGTQTSAIGGNITTAAEFSLGQNYPNPFNPTTTITYSMDMAGHVQLTVYNILGQQVRMLVNEMRTAGKHDAVWDGRDELGYALPSGFYVYQLKVGTKSETKRMLMIK